MIEKRMQRLERRFNTLYNRMYARHQRRDRQKHNAQNLLYQQYKSAANKIKKLEGMGNVLGAIKRELEKGRMFFTVMPQEYASLRNMLKRKRKKRVFSL